MLREIINKNELLLKILYIYFISIFCVMCFITLIVKIEYFIIKYEFFNTNYLKEFINLKEEFIFIFKQKYDLNSDTENYYTENIECFDSEEIGDIENNLNNIDNFPIDLNEKFLRKPISNKKYYTNLKKTYSILLKPPEEQKTLLNKYLDKINIKLGMGLSGDYKSKQE